MSNQNKIAVPWVLEMRLINVKAARLRAPEGLGLDMSKANHPLGQWLVSIRSLTTSVWINDPDYPSDGIAAYGYLTRQDGMHPKGSCVY